MLLPYKPCMDDKVLPYVLCRNAKAVMEWVLWLYIYSLKTSFTYGQIIINDRTVINRLPRQNGCNNPKVESNNPHFQSSHHFSLRKFPITSESPPNLILHDWITIPAWQKKCHHQFKPIPCRPFCQYKPDKQFTACSGFTIQIAATVFHYTGAKSTKSPYLIPLSIMNGRHRTQISLPLKFRALWR